MLLPPIPLFWVGFDRYKYLHYYQNRINILYYVLLPRCYIIKLFITTQIVNEYYGIPYGQKWFIFVSTLYNH